eukprot:351575_1
MSSLHRIVLDLVDDKTKCIIYGYIRNVQKLLNKQYFFISNDIANTCLSYISCHFMFSSGLHQWIFEYTKQQIKCENPIKMANLSWDLWCEKEVIFLKLNRNPESWKEVIFCCTINCPEFHTKSTTICTKFKSYRGYDFEFDGIINAYTQKNQDDSSTSCSSSDEDEIDTHMEALKKDANNIEKVTLNIFVQVLRIFDGETKILYDFMPNNIQREQQIQWKIDKKLIQVMTKMPKRSYERNSKLNDMFCIRFIPDSKSSKKDIDIQLQLKYLPETMISIFVKWTVTIDELQINKICKHDFSYDEGETCRSYYEMDDHENERVMYDTDLNLTYKSFQDFSKLNNMTIIVNIEILDMLDVDDRVDEDRGWANFINETNNINSFRRWLDKDVNLSEYYDLFVSNGVNALSIAKLLTMDTLIEIGIKKVGHRLCILNQIKILKNKEEKNAAGGKHRREDSW